MSNLCLEEAHTALQLLYLAGLQLTVERLHSLLHRLHQQEFTFRFFQQRLGQTTLLVLVKIL